MGRMAKNSILASIRERLPACFLFVFFLSSASATSEDYLHWHEESYPLAGWSSGQGPFGFNDPSVKSSITPYLPTYYFSRLFYLPGYDEIPLENLIIRIYCSDGVIAYVHGRECGRSDSLPPGDLPYEQSADFPDPDAYQEFDASWLLRECENGLRSSLRSISVEIHRVNRYQSDFIFSVELIGLLDEGTTTLLSKNSSWYYYPGSTSPPVIESNSIKTIVTPITGYPAFCTAGEIIPLTLAEDAFQPTHLFIATSRNYTFEIPVVSYQSSDIATLIYRVLIPPDTPPGLYDIILIDNGQQVDWSHASLKIMPETSSDLTFAHITDSHIPFRGNYAPNNTEILIDVLETIYKLRPDAIIHTGDGYNEGNMLDQAKLFHSIIENAEVPVIYVSGNHELGEWCGDGSSRWHYWRFFGWPEMNPELENHWDPITRDIWISIGDYQLIGLESWVNYTDYWKPYYRTTSFLPSQIQWLIQLTSGLPEDSVRIAFFHHDFNEQLDEILPEEGFKISLSGHTHESSEETTGGVLNLKTDATYNSNRPLRWICFRDKELIQYPELRTGSIQIEPVDFDPFEFEKTLQIRNLIDSDILGCNIEVYMPPGTQYRAADARKMTQMTTVAGEKLSIQYDLYELESKSIVISPAGAIPDISFYLYANDSLAEYGDSLTIDAAFSSHAFYSEIDLYIALFAENNWYFWPDWGNDAKPVRIKSAYNYKELFPIIDIDFWPEISSSGSFELYAIATESFSTQPLSDLSHLKIFYIHHQN